jgi:hypothetical protein
MCGHGRRWRSPVAPRGYTYVGPCRCGFGPHAFYQDPQSRVVPAHHLYCRHGHQPTNEDLKAELEALKHEKEELEKEIQELEKELNRE